MKACGCTMKSIIHKIVKLSFNLKLNITWKELHSIQTYNKYIVEEVKKSL